MKVNRFLSDIKNFCLYLNFKIEINLNKEINKTLDKKKITSVFEFDFKD